MIFVVVMLRVVMRIVGELITRVVIETLLLLLTLLRNRARSSRATVAARIVTWRVANINLGEVVVRVITEGSLESNLIVLAVVGSRSSRLRSSRGRHFSICFFDINRKI
jgi:hypothetical protein